MLLYQQLDSSMADCLMRVAGVRGLMAAAYKPDLAVSIGSYMHDMLDVLEG